MQDAGCVTRECQYGKQDTYVGVTLTQDNVTREFDITISVAGTRLC
jgi:hypothetical protein